MVPAAVLEKIIATWISHLRLVLMLGSSSRALPRTIEPRVIISTALGPPSHPHTPRAYAQTVALAICVHAAYASNVVETASASEPFTNPIHLSLYLQIKFFAQHPRIKSSSLRPASQHQAPRHLVRGHHHSKWLGTISCHVWLPHCLSRKILRRYQQLPGADANRSRFHLCRGRASQVLRVSMLPASVL